MPTRSHLIDLIAENSATTIDGHQIWLDTAELHPLYGFPIVYDNEGKWVNVRQYLNSREDKIEGYNTVYRSACRFHTCIHPTCRVPEWRLKPGFVAA